MIVNDTIGSSVPVQDNQVQNEIGLSNVFHSLVTKVDDRIETLDENSLAMGTPSHAFV